MTTFSHAIAIIVLMLFLTERSNGEAFERNDLKPFGIKRRSDTSEPSTMNEFDQAEEAIFHAVEEAEHAVIGAIKDEVEQVFHSIPNHRPSKPKVQEKDVKGTPTINFDQIIMNPIAPEARGLDGCFNSFTEE